MQTLNNQVACKPLENTAVKSKTVGSLRVGDFGHGGNLLPLTVVVDFKGSAENDWEPLCAGTVLYVKADCIQHPWVKAICLCDGVKKEDGTTPQPFILVPLNQIVLVA